MSDIEGQLVGEQWFPPEQAEQLTQPPVPPAKKGRKPMVKFTGEIHAYADAFPMLPEADLDALAADIKANGLVHPLVLTPDGALLDGRNRLEACRRVGIEPTFTVFTGADAVKFVVSANLQRRDLTATQKVYLAIKATMQPVAVDNRSGVSTYPQLPSTRELAKIAGVSNGLATEALLVAQYLPARIDALIVAGSGASHKEVHADAQKEKKRKSDEEETLALLAEKAPNLLALVRDEALTLAGARAAYEAENAKEIADAKKAAEWRKKLRDTLVEAVLGAGTCAHPNNIAKVAEGLAEHPPTMEDTRKELTPDGIRRAAECLRAVADFIEKESAK